MYYILISYSTWIHSKWITDCSFLSQLSLRRVSIVAANLRWVEKGRNGRRSSPCPLETSGFEGRREPLGRVTDQSNIPSWLPGRCRPCSVFCVHRYFTSFSKHVLSCAVRWAGQCVPAGSFAACRQTREPQPWLPATIAWEAFRSHQFGDQLKRRLWRRVPGTWWFCFLFCVLCLGGETFVCFLGLVWFFCCYCLISLQGHLCGARRLRFLSNQNTRAAINASIFLISWLDARIHTNKLSTC